MKISRIFLLLSSICLIFFSCEKEKSGIVDPNLNSPFLTAVELQYKTLNLDNDSTGAVHNVGSNKYNITIHFSGIALRNHSVSSHKVELQIVKPRASSPFSTIKFILSGTESDTLSFGETISFQVNREDIGHLRFLFSIDMNSGHSSNTVEKTLLITRNNSKPLVNNIVAPDTILLPSSGYKLLLFSVTVNDPDGYRDIQESYLKRIHPTETTPIMMADNGDKINFGDEIAGDGIFSRILRIDSTARLGDQVFLFQARDNSAALSDSLLHTITIIQP